MIQVKTRIVGNSYPPHLIIFLLFLISAARPRRFTLHTFRDCKQTTILSSSPLFSFTSFPLGGVASSGVATFATPEEATQCERKRREATMCAHFLLTTIKAYRKGDTSVNKVCVYTQGIETSSDVHGLFRIQSTYKRSYKFDRFPDIFILRSIRLPPRRLDSKSTCR